MEQHVENLRKFIQDQTETSPKETNNSEISYTRDNNIEPPIHSDTIEVQDLQVPTTFVQEEVQEEELIVEPTQQVFGAAHLDEIDKMGTMVFFATKDKPALFATLIPHIKFVIPNKFNDVMEFKDPLFSILPTVVPDLKQVLRIIILLLQHFKTRGRVFSNQGSMM